MSIFTNRIISNAYYRMYKTPIMESRSYIYESAIDTRINNLAKSIAKDIFKTKYNTPVTDSTGNPQTYARSGNEMKYNWAYIKHLVGEKIPFSKDQKSNAKFFLGSVRIFGEILKNSQTEEEVNRQCSSLNKILGVIVNDSNHINEYDNNLNGKSLEELENIFGKKVKEISDKEKEEINSKTYIKNGLYTITPCNTWEDIKQFGSPLTTWCVAQEDGKHAYDSYTDNGFNKFYVCTRKGYEKLDPVPGDNYPLDEYGLSMIAVCVDQEGNLKTCTCRWNHMNGGNDNIMDAKQISDLLGVNFFEKFKPMKAKDIFAKLKYFEDNPLCSHFGFRYDISNGFYFRIENNKIIKYTKCYHDPTKTCLSNTHFEWYNLKTRKKIDPPEYVDGDFNCLNCDKLTSLKGSPSEVGGDFDCSECINLTSLEGAPNKVDGGFWCNACSNLRTLEGAPSKVGGTFSCHGCKKLTSLNGSPSEVGGCFRCGSCKNLISLEGGPNKVGKDFLCYGCDKLTSLTGAPAIVGGDFDCSSCKNLTSLEGAPTEVRGSFRCSGSYKLASFEGAPSEVGGGFYCSDCYKLSLNDDIPESIRDKILW